MAKTPITEGFAETTLSGSVSGITPTLGLTTCPSITIGYAVLDGESSTNREVIYFTGNSNPGGAGNLTGCSRGLTLTPGPAPGTGAGQTNEVVVGNQKTHNSGASVSFTNVAQLHLISQLRTTGVFISGALNIADDQGPYMKMSRGGYLLPITLTNVSGVIAYVKTAPAGGVVTIDIEKSSDNGATWATIFTTLVTIDNTEISNITAAIPAAYSGVLNEFVPGDLFRLNLDAVNAAEDLTLTLQFIYTE